MSDSFFIDTNIALYTFDGNAVIKQKKSRDLILLNPIISTQVLSEYTNICLKKLKFTKEKAFFNTKVLSKSCSVAVLDTHTYDIAFEISLKYDFSFWDSLIVASALENN